MEAISRATQKLRVTATQLAWEIQQYINQKKGRNLTIKDLVRRGDFSLSVEKCIRDSIAIRRCADSNLRSLVLPIIARIQQERFDYAYLDRCNSMQLLESVKAFREHWSYATEERKELEAVMKAEERRAEAFVADPGEVDDVIEMVEITLDRRRMHE